MMGGENEGFMGKEKKISRRKPMVKNRESSSNLLRAQPMVSEGINPANRMVSSDNNLGSNRDGLSGNGGFLRQATRVRISLSMKSKQEVRQLKRKLEEERDMVRNLMRKIDANEAQKNPRVLDNLERDNVGPPRMSKPLNQLSVSVFENTKSGNENVEKEKRAPKEKPLYMNSEFLLAEKDKSPLLENNKKSKSNNKQGRGSQLGPTSGSVKFPNHVLKKCKALLEKLMRNKHAWVFKKPVDVAGLGLHDYFQMIKVPMDLGTVKKRLTQSWYTTPLEFAEDVRLTFQNAMTYNPKGHDVYVMAEELSKIFEVNWAPLEGDYMHEFKNAVDSDVGLPTTREAPPQPRTQPVMEKINNKKRKPKNITQSGEISVRKEPKEDPKEREMTYDEKQNLSINLQNLPSEKLETVVEIIRNRTTSLTQEDDEIEIDIDTVDPETLWELHRLINNYTESSSKNEKKSESISQFITGSEQITQEKIPSSIITETPEGHRADVVQVAEPGLNDTNQEASQSSSSTGSGSSSSDSDGESSSGDGSDGGHSPIVEICRSNESQ